MALWEAPITPTVTLEAEGMILQSTDGLRAGSSPISWTLLNGSGLVVGEEPVQRTTRSEETVMGSENFGSREEILTFQLLDYQRSAGYKCRRTEEHSPLTTMLHILYPVACTPPSTDPSLW
jgi:hypothetical protein